MGEYYGQRGVLLLGAKKRVVGRAERVGCKMMGELKAHASMRRIRKKKPNREEGGRWKDRGMFYLTC